MLSKNCNRPKSLRPRAAVSSRPIKLRSPIFNRRAAIHTRSSVTVAHPKISIPRAHFQNAHRYRFTPHDRCGANSVRQITFPNGATHARIFSLFPSPKNHLEKI